MRKRGNIIKKYGALCVRGDIYISAHFGGAHYHQREGLSDVVDRGREGERGKGSDTGHFINTLSES